MNSVSTRTAAIITGVSLLTMTIGAGFSFGHAHGKLFIVNSFEMTSKNIQNSPSLLQQSIFGWIIILISDIFVSWSLHIYYKKQNENLSLITGWFRIIYSAMLACAITNLFNVNTLIKNFELFSASLDEKQLQTQIFFSYSNFLEAWSFGLIIFGIHLILLGVLIMKTNCSPKIFGWIIFIAGVGYILVHGSNLLLGEWKYKDALENSFILPQVVGELGLAIWMLIKGGFSDDSEKQK
eukprot:gene7300-11619_t